MVTLGAAVAAGVARIVARSASGCTLATVSAALRGVGISTCRSITGMTA